MVDFKQLTKQLRHEIREANKGCRHVAIMSEGTDTILHWKYDGHEVEARSKDYNLLSLLRQCIEIYLEETEEEEKEEN